MSMEGDGKRKREDLQQEHQEHPRNNINARKLIRNFSSPVNFLGDVRLQPRFYGGVFELGESSNRNQINQQKETLRIGMALSQESQQMNGHQDLRQHPKSHMKASNIPALSLKIGNWEWVSKNEGDLVAKFYFGTKKLVWELLWGYRKKKIEFRWSQITAINAYADGNQNSRLVIQLKERPKLYEEVKFNPKKRTQWETAVNDFTGGQTHISSLHTIRFAPRVLDDPLANLLECDKRLSSLTQQPFPYHDPRVFHSRILDFSCNRSIHAIVPNNDYQGTNAPYAPNLVQPVRSFVGYSSCNLPTPVLKSPCLDKSRNILRMDLRNDAVFTNRDTNFETNPVDQSYEMKSTTADKDGTVFEEHNSGLPVEARIGMDDSTDQVKDHLAYVVDQMFSDFDPVTFQVPNSGLHPEFNKHEFSNGGNGVNHIGYVVDDDELLITSIWD